MPLWPRWRARYRVSQLRGVTDGQASSTFVPHPPSAWQQCARLRGDTRRMFVSSSSPSADLSALTCSNDNRVRRRAAEQRDELAPVHCPVPPVLTTERIAPRSTGG